MVAGTMADARNPVSALAQSAEGPCRRALWLFVLLVLGEGVGLLWNVYAPSCLETLTVLLGVILAYGVQEMGQHSG